MESKILAVLARKNYVPVKPKLLARKIGVTDTHYAEFQAVLRDLVKRGLVQFGRNHTVRPGTTPDTAVGIFRRLSTGRGFVRVAGGPGSPAGSEIAIAESDTLDASTGDEVQVLVVHGYRGGPPQGEVVRVLQRATRQFVGTYHERDGQGLVRVDGGLFAHSIDVGDPGAKGARVDDKVVIEMLRFPTLEDRGEAVITEVLGPRGAPGVDTLSVIRAFDLPEEFPPEVLEEARLAAEAFDETELDGRVDETQRLVITIDPVDARDFDDAIDLERDARTGHWILGVHIADVGHFAPPGSALDREARHRATSVYLPQRVLPMFPELISNGLASLHQGKRRYVKTVRIEFTPEGAFVHAKFSQSVIQVTRRLTYEQAMAFLQSVDEPAPAAKAGKKPRAARSRPTASDPSASSDLPAPRVQPAAAVPDLTAAEQALLLRMRELALILRGRRLRRGALELSMPEVALDFDAQGKVVGAHCVPHDISHQIIEEFMLAANEAVAGFLHERGVAFLRRVHPAPEDSKLKAFAEFARSLGFEIRQATDRFALQRLLLETASLPEHHAVHYALLRSLKQAVYSPLEEEHYALASAQYCHFTSPIRRYPDLTAHRLIDQWLRDGRLGSDPRELAFLGDHCSRMEKRAEAAERELVKLRLLEFLSERVGLRLSAVITGVADYGFFALGQEMPIEGRVHISTLTDDYYVFEESAHSLTGRRTGRRFRLGDPVRVEVVRVDLTRRQLDLRVVDGEPRSEKVRKLARPQAPTRRGVKSPKRRRRD